MLRVSSQQFIPNKMPESIMRHRFRNLRAKVRALLPIAVCEKHCKRNNKIKRIQHSQQIIRRTQSSNLSAHKWTFPLEKETVLFHEKLVATSSAHMFNKLSQQDIQLIQEDNIYYLGEEQHIKAFQEFISRKKDKISYSGMSNSIRPETKVKDWTNSIVISESGRKRSLDHFPKSQKSSIQRTPSTIINSIVSRERKSEMTMYKPRFISCPARESRMDRFLKKKAEVQQESLIRMFEMRTENRTKQQKAVKNQTQIRTEYYATLREKARLESQKHQRAKIRRLKHEENHGEIVGLTEKIRLICLEKRDFCD